MGRRKLDIAEKLERQNARKELKKTKMSVIQENNGLLLSEIKTEIQGVINKNKRGRKAKIENLLEPQMNTKIDNDLLLMFKTQDKNSQITILTNKNNSNNNFNSIKYHLPWIEKYRPKYINDIILEDNFKSKILNLIELNTLPNIIISGSSGTGKTSTIYCIARQLLKEYYKDALLELNASDNRGLDIINNTIIYFCQKRINSIKIIIFDEADNITTKAQNSLVNLMDEYSYNTRFCFTCNDSSKIIESIQSRCLILHYKPMNNENIKKRLKYICDIEKVNYNEPGLDSIIFISQGDIRHAINNLEAIHNSYRFVSEENVYKLCYQPHPSNLITIIQYCVNGDIKNAILEYDKLRDFGYCNSDILQTMINILKLIKIDENIRINYIKIISDIYLNINDGIDSNLQIYSCLSKLIKFIN